MAKSQKVSFINGLLNKVDPFYNENSNFKKNITTVVLHWTSSTGLDTSIKKVKAIKYNYHFMVDTDGKIYQTARTSKRVSHAGLSYGPNGKFLNTYSLGIGLIPVGGLAQEKNVHPTQEQIDSVALLISDLMLSNEDIKYLTGHHEIAPGRKTDPYSFPYKDTIKKINSINPDGRTIKYWSSRSVKDEGDIIIRYKNNAFVFNSKNTVRTFKDHLTVFQGAFITDGATDEEGDDDDIT